MNSTLSVSVFLLLANVSGASAGAADHKAADNPAVFNRTSNEESIAETTALRVELLREVGAALGGVDASGEFGSDIDEIEHVLLPIIAASPKNVYGRLEDAASRYVMHRYFMQRHGWDMRTFVSSNQSEEETTCLFDFGRQVPFAVQAALEKRIADRGASVAELSVFIALLEHLVRDEVPGKVEAAYRAIELSRTELLTERQAAKLIDFHMSLQISAEDASNYNPEKVARLLENMPKAYAGWNYAEQMFRSVQATEARDSTGFSFADMVRILTQLEKNLSQLQNHQCQKMKTKLSSIEVLGSGRVRLSDFYNSALTDGNVEFMESLPYLRQLGAVDETHGEPQVVISNYLDGPSNCIAASSYYSACCFDECVDLYTELERAIKKPVATPEEIASAMRRSYVLSEKQVGRLQEFAQEHFGLIPLHSQSFAHWMHEVFPRECSDPSLSGPAHFMTLPEWASTSGVNYVVSVPEAQFIVDQARASVEVETFDEDGIGSSLAEDTEQANDGMPDFPDEDAEDVDTSGDANSNVTMSVDKFSDESQTVEQSPLSEDAFAKSTVSPWVHATRWAAVVLVTLLVPVRMLWNVHAHHVTKLSKDGLRKPTQVETSDLEASIIMDRV